MSILNRRDRRLETNRPRPGAAIDSNRGGISPRAPSNVRQGSVPMSVSANLPTFSLRAALARGAGF